MWEENPDGTIRTQPIVGWTMAAFPENVLTRLEMLREDGTLASCQFHMPSAQAREFAGALLRRADLVDAGTTESP